jgi:hypothetical protein
MASKGGLSNKLLGRKIIPQPGLERVWPKKSGVPYDKHNIEPSDLLFTEAEIVAAWVEKDPGGASYVKVSAVSDGGDVVEFYLTHVKIKPQGSVFVKPEEKP